MQGEAKAVPKRHDHWSFGRQWGGGLCDPVVPTRGRNCGNAPSGGEGGWLGAPTAFSKQELDLTRHSNWATEQVHGNTEGSWILMASSQVLNSFLFGLSDPLFPPATQKTRALLGAAPPAAPLKHSGPVVPSALQQVLITKPLRSKIIYPC